MGHQQPDIKRWTWPLDRRFDSKLAGMSPSVRAHFLAVCFRSPILLLLTLDAGILGVGLIAHNDALGNPDPEIAGLAGFVSVFAATAACYAGWVTYKLWRSRSAARRYIARHPDQASRRQLPG